MCTARLGWGMATVDRESVEYFRARERVERDAAANASNEAARRVHLELAQGYAALVGEAEHADG
jgi:hypothetical protein